MLALRELDRSVGKSAAAAAAFVAELGHASQQRDELPVRIAGDLLKDLPPYGIPLGGELSQVRGDKRVLGGEMPIKRHFVGARGGGDRVDADGADPVAVEKLSRGGEDALARRRGAGPAPFRSCHGGGLTVMLPIGTMNVTTQ